MQHKHKHKFRTVQSSSRVRQKGSVPGPSPPPVNLLPESIAAQTDYQLCYKNTEYYSWVGSGPKCFQVLGLSQSLLQNPQIPSLH
jgi:hypothetical protein